MSTEQVVLLDRRGRVIGHANKREVHHDATPLHLAFSCYVIAPDGSVLVTRRALNKRVFPGVWTNSLCGHPGPGESLPDAVCRRAQFELGLVLADIRLVLPDFAYLAQMNGVVENEMCPVFAAIAESDSAGAMALNRDEVAAVAWMPWSELTRRAEQPGWSPWIRQQIVALDALGADPRQWSDGDPAALPPAARPSVPGAQLSVPGSD